MCSTCVKNRNRAVPAMLALVAGLMWAASGVTAQADADLEVESLSDSPDPVVAGDLLVYTISFVNSGPGSATNVVILMGKPASTVISDHQVLSGSGWTDSTGLPAALFTKEVVASGETASFSVTVEVLSTTPNGTVILAVASTASDTDDPVAGNNTAVATTPVSTAADLQVLLTDSPDPVNPGNNITYDFSMTNGGPSDAQNVVVTLPVPAGTTFVSGQVLSGSGWGSTTPSVGGTGNVEFTKGTVALSEATVFQVVVNVNAGASGVVNATTTATSTTTDPNPGDNASTATTTITSEPCSLRVRRPNGGEVWVIGTKERIKWVLAGSCCEYVRIELWQNGSRLRKIKKSTLNDGKVGWKIKPTKYVPGTGYKVRIRCLDGSGVQDFSNGPFTLVAP